jgi:hypothetical protein
MAPGGNDRLHLLGPIDTASSCLRSARGSVVSWGTMLQARRLQVRFPMRLLDFFNLPNPSSRIMALGSTQPLTEMSIRNLPGGKGRSAHKAGNLTAICEPLVGASTSHNSMGLHGLLRFFLRCLRFGDKDCLYRLGHHIRLLTQRRGQSILRNVVSNKIRAWIMHRKLTILTIKSAYYQ